MKMWLRCALLLAVVALGLGGTVLACAAVRVGDLFVLPDLPDGHLEVAAIRADYRARLDPLTKRWEKAELSERVTIEAEAQPIWEDYCREVAGACERHGLNTPKVSRRWAETVKQPWEK